ncbi:immunodominant staphylococcal antigen IsaB family protein [Macrococcus sp. EM39E]|uniref:immunodominant staphylococcal antigen IsaB family protein n=1 Tax=Macrococcus animalis TaxID=3395467 RepID=UPI0039BDA8DC
MKSVQKIMGMSLIATSLILAPVSLSETPDVQAAHYTKPYYNYNGYTKNSAKFVLDPYFVKALYYDNVKLNGYKVNPKAKVALGGVPMHIYDASYLKDKNGKVGYFKFEVKKKTVKKYTFKKAHKKNEILEESNKSNNPGVPSYIVYKTKGAVYLASFDKNGYLTGMEVGVVPGFIGLR